MNAAYEFIKAIQSANLTPPEGVVPDGKLHRFSTNGKHGDDAGWYVFHDDGIPAAGAFGDWRSGLSRIWRADLARTLTPAEEAAHQRRVDAMRRAREAEEARRHAQAREKTAQIWKAAKPASTNNPYLTLKGVSPVESLRDIDAAEAARILGYAPKYRGEPLTGLLLVVPIKVASELSTVEFIDESGRKSALYGGAKAGGYWAAQPLPNGDGAGLTLLIGEGVATLLSAREATGYLVIAALSSSNLLAVARKMRERYPAAVLVILDDLVKVTGDPDPHAIEAARAVGGLLAIPDFGEDRPEDLKDFNDLAAHRGLEAVQLAIASAKAPDIGGTTAHATDEGEDLGATVGRLADLSPIEYDRVRQVEADVLGVRVATLDSEVRKAREAMDPSGGVSIQGQAVVFDDPEPWPSVVDGSAAIDEVFETLSGHLALPDSAADAMALWTAHTHCHLAFLHSPRLNITSPEKGCGKTLVLDILHTLAPKAIRTESITTAVLFRIVDKFTPTLLVDEYDAFIHDNEDLRGALNAGHKRGGMHLRCEGDKNEVRGFRTFTPVALAGIRDLPERWQTDRSSSACRGWAPTSGASRSIRGGPSRKRSCVASSRGGRVTTSMRWRLPTPRCP
jgi:putative DNA primase/helicase